MYLNTILIIIFLYSLFHYILILQEHSIDSSWERVKAKMIPPKKGSQEKLKSLNIFMKKLIWTDMTSSMKFKNPKNSKSPIPHLIDKRTKTQKEAKWHAQNDTYEDCSQNLGRKSQW